jgi:hypothetical protein
VYDNLMKFCASCHRQLHPHEVEVGEPNDPKGQLKNGKTAKQPATAKPRFESKDLSWT